MTTVEMEKPVVSKELAETFEELRNECDMFPSEFILFENYNKKIPEYENLCCDDFEDLLARMYVLGYEIRNPKLKYIRLRAVQIAFKKNYLNLATISGTYFVDDCEMSTTIKTQFTQEEVDEFLKDEPDDMWVVQEVEDQ